MVNLIIIATMYRIGNKSLYIFDQPVTRRMRGFGVRENGHGRGDGPGALLPASVSASNIRSALSRGPAVVYVTRP
jgi:hypothetical protein